MSNFAEEVISGLTKIMTGGADESHYDRNDLAKRSNEQLVLQGRKVTVRKVKETSFFMGC